jgi:chromosome segregation ATPase
MYLKALTINGFKSFAKKGELEFSAPITAIVGPNGSGKSNVAESFRFVLGEQSVKSMRGKRGEDLIWGGSESVSRGNRAQVEVVLDNSKRQFPLDFDEVRIERVVHRDGQNEYLLNGSAVRLKDIQELLAVANIGSTGHHIISQGEADRILSAGPRERREMIEDALGLKVYQLKKNEAERKLEKTRENIAQVESLRREAAPHLKYLEKQVQKIEKSLEVQAKLKGAYLEYLKREDAYIAFHTDRLTAERREPEAVLEEVKKQLAAAKEILQAAEASDEKSSGVVAAEEAWRAASKDRQTVLHELGQIEGQLAYLVRRIEERGRHKVAPLPAIPRGELERVVNNIEEQVAGVAGRDDLSLVKRTLTDVVRRLRVLLERAPEAPVVDDGEELAKERAELEVSAQALRGKMEAAEASEREAEAAYNDVRKSLEAEAYGARQAEREVFRLVGEQRMFEGTVERIDRELSALERDRDEFKRELEEAVALLGREVARYFETPLEVDGAVVTAEAIAAEDRSLQRARRHELEKLKIRLEELGMGATDDTLKEWQEAKERDAFLEREVADLTASVEKLTALIAELTAELQEQFFAGIDKISVEFNTFFTLMFGGGEASLARVEPKVKIKNEDEEGSEDSEEERETEVGIELNVKLPNKRVKGLEMLSGGERALTSIALIFAMSQVNPPPFVILDETDAALDEANSRRYGDLIEALAKKSQLILITHNRETMSRASVLYGITMGSDGVSKLLSVRLEEALAVAK